MQASNKLYVLTDSVARIDEVLTTSDNQYEEVDSIPSRDKLTFTNGFYVYCSCVYMDIRKSSELPSEYKRPTLARLYRSYISESIAVLNDSEHCCEVTIDGDAVWGVFDTPSKADIDDTFSTAAKLASLIDVLNCRFKKKTNITPITVGIGMAYGRALMLKAGYKGSGINDVVWMGDVVNKASKLASYGNREWGDKRMMVSNVFQGNLNEHNQGLLSQHAYRECYHGGVINTVMNDWVNENCD